MNPGDGMECPGTAVLEDYLDRRLSPAEAARTRAHLSRCPACGREAESLAAVGQAIRALPLVDPGRDFTRRVLSRLGSVPPRPAVRPGLRLTPAELALVSVLCAVGGLLLLQTTLPTFPAPGWPPGAPLAFVDRALSVLQSFVEGWVASAARWPSWTLPAAGLASGAVLASSLAHACLAAQSQRERNPRP